MGFAATLGFARNLLFGYFLEPENMGYYSIAITVATYGVFLQLGLMSGLNRELPVRLGKEQYENAEYLVATTHSTSTFLQSISLLIYFIILFFIPFEDLTRKEVLFLAGLIVLPNQFLNIAMLRLRSEQRVVEYAFLQFLKDLLIVLIGIVVIQYFEYVGAIFSIIIVNLGIYFFITKQYLKPYNYFYKNREYLYYLLKIGLPIMFAGLMLNLYLTMDRLFLFYSASPEVIGIYQIALLPITLGIIVNAYTSQYVFPRLLFRYGEGQSLRYVYNQALKSSLVVLSGMALLGPVFLFTTGYVINNYMPLYVESIPLMKIFYFAAIFASANLVEVVIIASNKTILIFIENGLVALVAFVLFASSSQSLLWYAYTVLIIQIIKFFLSLLNGYAISYNSIQKRN